MESENWIEAQEGVWFKWADDYSCGYFNCIYAYVAVEELCSRGVYVEVTIERDGVAIGRDIEVTPALIPQGNKLAMAELEFIDTSDSATHWQPVRIYCRG
jgi:hypothetical protein